VGPVADMAVKRIVPVPSGNRTPGRADRSLATKLPERLLRLKWSCGNAMRSYCSVQYTYG